VKTLLANLGYLLSWQISVRLVFSAAYRFQPLAQTDFMTAELTLVIPTFNERDNIKPLLGLIDTALAGRSWEAVFVDDNSNDGTLEVLHDITRRDPRVRAIQRIGRRGLSTAVIEGILSSSAPFVGVIDADMQHDERLLPAMLALLQTGKSDIVVGSRYVAGGGLGKLDPSRQSISRFATRLARLVVKNDLTDPMSGFFMLTRTAFLSASKRLSGQGYKILLDIFASSPTPLRLAELPYEFRNRQHGESKLDSMVVIEYLMLLLDKLVGHIVPVRFLLFVAVGGLGVFVHFAVLTPLKISTDVAFATAQSVATIVAMTFNYFVNNLLTYRDRRLKGLWGNMRGLLSFYAVCSVGAIANVGIANYFFKENYAGWIVAALAGTVVGAAFNYAATSVFTWRK
jgi:dolichol-phosphate mannosyltransferase